MTQALRPALPARRNSTIEEIAAEIQAMVLTLEEGDFLGSEEGLSRHFRVSAPTLRQAARLLEHQGLLSVRRGVQGGYFVERPTIETVSRSAAIYLRGNPGLMDQVPELFSALEPFIVDQLLASGRLAELEPFAAPRATLAPLAEMREETARFGSTIRDMIGNAPLQLVMTIFFQIGQAVPHPEHPASPETLRQVQDDRIALARALIERDRDETLRLFHVHFGRIHAGVRASMKAAASG